MTALFRWNDTFSFKLSTNSIRASSTTPASHTLPKSVAALHITLLGRSLLSGKAQARGDHPDHVLARHAPRSGARALAHGPGPDRPLVNEDERPKGDITPPNFLGPLLEDAAKSRRTKDTAGDLAQRSPLRPCAAYHRLGTMWRRLKSNRQRGAARGSSTPVQIHTGVGEERF